MALIIREITDLQLQNNDENSPVAEIKRALEYDFTIRVIKGIHPDTHGIVHILVALRQPPKKYHLNLGKAERRRENDNTETFIWRIESITSRD